MSHISEWELLILLLLIFASSCSSSVAARELLHHILKDNASNTLLRPSEHGEAVDVTLTLDLQQILDIEEKDQVLISNVWITIEWMDSRLSWNPADFGGITRVRVPPHLVWKPDILLYNSIGSPDPGYKVNVLIWANGSMQWIPPNIVNTTCDIDITYYPFDEQFCKLKYGSWVHHAYLINLKVGGIGTGTYMKNGEWDLVDVKAERTNFTYEGDVAEPDLFVEFKIHLRRRTLYYGFNLILPSILLSLLALLDFALPAFTDEKLALGITVFMSLSLLLLMIAKQLPTTSEALALIDVYFLIIMLLISMAQVFTVLVQNFHYRRPHTHIMQPIIRTIFLEWLPWLLLMDRPGFVVGKGCMLKFPDDRPANHNFELECFRPDFILESRMLQQYVETQRGLPVKRCAECVRHYPSDLVDQVTRLEISFCDLLLKLRQITTKIQADEVYEEMTAEWQYAAMSLDRLCMIACTIALITFTIAIIFSAPHIDF